MRHFDTKRIHPADFDNTDKWLWKMEWCNRRGLSPARNENWMLAEKAYQETDTHKERR